MLVYDWKNKPTTNIIQIANISKRWPRVLIPRNKGKHRFATPHIK